MAANNIGQNAVIAFLERPGVLAPNGPDRRIDTHGAILFMAGEQVFKMKRAVSYPYMDFSTLEKRIAVCKAELSLNRRTAPDLYLGLASVIATDNGGLSLVHDGCRGGQVAECLVVMRRFAREAQLGLVARRGELSMALLVALADTIADFHNSAAIVHDPAASQRVFRVIENNAASMKQAGVPDDGLAAISMGLAQNLASLLNERGAGGHVRRCHGDLHLGNICLWQGRPTLFDCLEFDEELATIDVLYDLAFLVMDLWRQGFCHEASVVFNRYLDMRDKEQAGLGAFGLFVSIRAAVRAHVTASACAMETDLAVRQKMQEQVQALLNLAHRSLQPEDARRKRPAPRLIGIGGLSGTGKSTLAGLLAPYIGSVPGARLLRTDVLRKRMAGVMPETRLSADFYGPDVTAKVYDQLYSDAEMILNTGHSVIVDGVFAVAEERRRIEEDIAAKTGAAFIGLWLDAPKDVLLARVNRRKGDASDADARVVIAQQSYQIGEPGNWRRVDASGDHDATLVSARRIIAAVD